MIFFAALAAVVLFQLYSVLGRRVGRQPEDAAVGVPRNLPAGDQAQPRTCLSSMPWRLRAWRR